MRNIGGLSAKKPFEAVPRPAAFRRLPAELPVQPEGLRAAVQVRRRAGERVRVGAGLAGRLPRVRRRSRPASVADSGASLLPAHLNHTCSSERNPAHAPRELFESHRTERSKRVGSLKLSHHFNDFM
jgi:hypothetical protein